MWLRLCAAALPIAASAVVTPAADAKSSNSFAIGMAGAVEADSDLLRQHDDGGRRGGAKGHRAKLRKLSHREKIRATLAHHRHHAWRQRGKMRAWRSAGKSHAHLHQRHRDIQAHLNLRLHAHPPRTALHMPDLTDHKKGLAATKSVTDKLGHLVLSLHDRARIPLPQPRPVLIRRRDDDGQAHETGTGWTDQSKRIARENQTTQSNQLRQLRRDDEGRTAAGLEMVEGDRLPAGPSKFFESQPSQSPTIATPATRQTQSAAALPEEGQQWRSGARIMPERAQQPIASAGSDEQAPSGAPATPQVTNSGLSAMAAVREDRAGATRSDNEGTSRALRMPPNEEMDLAKASPTPEPITEAERDNIFRRYEQGLLQPIGNCFDYEQIDPRIKRVVSDAAVHFAGVALLSSCYRSPNYNRRVHGARRSMHMQHKALDFVIRHDGHLIDKFVLAKWVRDHPIMRNIGGVGTYCGQDAIHADTGARRNWYWGCAHSSPVRSARAARRHHHVAMQ